MTESFHILHKGLKLEEVVNQVRAIDKFPCCVNLYDRVFMLSNKEEALAIATGIEIGFFLCEEALEKELNDDEP
jgi:hypothetical protein